MAKKGRKKKTWASAAKKGAKMGQPAPKTTGRCFQTHPTLEIFEGCPPIIGGSCSSPVAEDCDIYIGFERSAFRFTYRQFPWVKGEEIIFPIQDMGVPNSPKAFRDLAEWVLAQIKDGKTVHAGCIGGHGRTGLFLSVLVKLAGVSDDAITYVRQNYCKKVVESKTQINWLGEHFDIVTEGVEASKAPATTSTYTSGGKWPEAWKTQKAGGISRDDEGTVTVTPLEVSWCVWGGNGDN